jgi:YceI-like domain
VAHRIGCAGAGFKSREDRVTLRRRSQAIQVVLPVNAKVGDRYVMILEKTAIFCVLRSLLPLALISCVGSATGQETSIDTTHSKLLIHVSKSGLFSGFADNHEVEARIAKGSLDAKAGQLRLSVDSRQMRVLNPRLSSDKRQQVQERMLGPEVLDSSRFPEITFESTHAEQELEGRVS